jgi:hypothetical protein
LRSDVFRFTAHKKPLAGTAEFVLSIFQRRRAAIEGEDVPGIHE